VIKALSSYLAKAVLAPLHQVAGNLGSFINSRRPQEPAIAGVTNNNLGAVRAQEDDCPLYVESGQVPRFNSLDESADSSLTEAPSPKIGTWIVFLPRDPQWAYVFWEILDHDRELAQVAGAGQLCIRLVDVTDLTSGGSHRHTMQEVTVESHAKDWYLSIPLSGRAYRAELGYRKIGGGWLPLAMSSVALVPRLHPSERICDQFIPFSLENRMLQPLDTAPLEPHDTGKQNLHEILYQAATNPAYRWCQLGHGSEAFQATELRNSAVLATGNQSSGIGGLLNSSNASGTRGVDLRQRDLWLVADAELILYGATDPNARLSIGDEKMQLAGDGTFRVQVPFRDGQQIYSITTESFDGGLKRFVTVKFVRRTFEDNSMTTSDGDPNWR